MSKTTTSLVDFPSGQRTTLGVLVHLIGMVTGVVGAGIVYFLTDDKFTRSNARNSLNWWLLMFGIYFLLLMTILILGSIDDVFVYLAILASVGLGLASLVFAIRAAIKANDGEIWEYPFAPRLI